MGTPTCETSQLLIGLAILWMVAVSEPSLHPQPSCRALVDHRRHHSTSRMDHCEGQSRHVLTPKFQGKFRTRFDLNQSSPTGSPPSRVRAPDHGQEAASIGVNSSGVLERFYNIAVIAETTAMTAWGHLRPIGATRGMSAIPPIATDW
jgi:hypothetical protein